ncbi:phosphatidylinositol-glycan biosynthesis class X protein isoform X2 [Pezoporus wallicus]|uniref:phosphatidylinositol-glycan biosynthesis class X protein isoform X2 n=1 Tax=Pezoporus wallicus TaxID=35540 RepID=UPI0025518B33|nr:phosphatidylinositol-glycan biosynthesis class X protein isoform X2 [Pezoporus wallicus]XP_061321179.1 phosphatidylinositol-glycan biosynthesis class X protein isoform X2 [Pezoporus flaviventris]
MAGGLRWRGEALLSAALAAFLCAFRVQAVCEGATVTQELLKEGFHRDLLLKVELGVVREHSGGCTVAARTHLPPGIYVDPYELASLQQHNLTKAVLIPDVDVEAPEYLATDLLVLLYLEPDPWCFHCFTATLPVHGRYHRPAEDSEEVLVMLKSPEVLVCCCDSEILVTCSTGERGVTVGNTEVGVWFCICLLEMELSVACQQSVGRLLKWKLPAQAKMLAPVSGTA